VQPIEVGTRVVERIRMSAAAAGADDHSQGG
jgi:hypothetical protein